MTAHSSIGASSMERWAACPGSVYLSRGVPNESSKYAELGTAAHAVADIALSKFGVRVSLSSWVGNTIPYDDHGVAKEILLTSNMAGYLQVYLDFIHSRLLEASDPKPGDMHVEHKFDMSRLHPGLYGTADCVLWNPNTENVSVVDLKYGSGKAVKVEGNPQLRYYALGAVLSLYPKAKAVETVIVQPRCKHKDGPIRQEVITPFELLEWAGDLKSAAQAVDNAVDDALSTPEDEWVERYISPGAHCFFCPARRANKCPVKEKESLTSAILDFE